jgi:hypothetical protein
MQSVGLPNGPGGVEKTLKDTKQCGSRLLAV